MTETEATPSGDRPPLWLRAWQAVPDAAFRALGIGFAIVLLAGRLPEYADFPDIGHYWQPVYGTSPEGWPLKGPKEFLPLGKMLVDANMILLAIAFAIRLPARERASTARQILIPVVGGFWPFLPFLAHDALHLMGVPWPWLDQALAYGALSRTAFTFGVGLIVVGNALDVWAYTTLMRSFSIVAEARELKTGGPYRWVRHPVYLGQIVAQAGVWLVLLGPTWGSAAFWAAFVAMQLYRSDIEDGVLANAFGEAYWAWRATTWWFWP